MKSLMHVYGKGGDIAMSMAAALLIFRELDEPPSICVHGNYAEIARMLSLWGSPISGVVESRISPMRSDREVFGSSLSPFSENLLSHVYPGYDRHFNCCLGNVPKGTHIAGLLRYSTGLCESARVLSSDFLLRTRENLRSGTVVYHFGSSSKDRILNLERCPFPDHESVIVGLESDPTVPWADRDMRGIPMGKLFIEIDSADACIGSDSLITHISSLLSVPTVAVHGSADSLFMAARQVYGRHAASLVDQKGKCDLTDVIVGILSRFFHEFQD